MPLTDKQIKHYKWLNFGTIATVIGVIINVSMWKQNVDDRLLHVEKHVENKEVHMPFKEKIRLFSTKDDMNELKKSVTKIEEKLDRLIDYKLRNK